MSQEHAAAAFHAAKIAQLNAMGHSLDKLPPGLLPPHLDLSKMTSQHNSQNNSSPDLSRIHSGGSVTIEPANPKVPISIGHHINDRVDIRRESSEPMDLGYDNNQSHHHMINTRGHSGTMGGGVGPAGGGGLGTGGGGGGVAGNCNMGGNSSGEEDNFSDEDPEQNS